MPAPWRRSRSSAPEGCLLNAKRPRAVAARHTVGHMLPDVVFGCLHQVMAGGVPAEGASSLWNPQIYGGADVLDELGAEEGKAPPEIRPFSTAIFHCGGAGARPGKDGLDVTAFPSGVRTIPVEATEVGGAGAVPPPRVPRRLGRGRAISRRARPDHRIGRRRRHADRDAVQFRAHRQPGARPRRRRCWARRAGSRSSPAGRSAPKGRQSVPGGDFIRLELPGGGGFGDPAERDPEQVAARRRRRADLARDRRHATTASRSPPTAPSTDAARNGAMRASFDVWRPWDRWERSAAAFLAPAATGLLPRSYRASDCVIGIGSKADRRSNGKSTVMHGQLRHTARKGR